MYRYFSYDTDRTLFVCSETGEEGIDPIFVTELDYLRGDCNFPFIITSGFRSEKHSKEIVKEQPGTHPKGIAADIKISNGTQRFILVQKALARGFTGIGIAKTFVHVDMRDTTPVIWTY